MGRGLARRGRDLPRLRDTLRLATIAIFTGLLAACPAGADPIFTIAGGRLHGPTYGVQATDVVLPAATRDGNEAIALAPGPDGTYYTGSSAGLLHVRRDGIAARVSEEVPSALAVRPDGAVLYGTVLTVGRESTYYAVRLLRPNGSVATVAGRPARPDDSSQPGSRAPGDGDPATDAVVGRIEALAAMPDGGFAMSESTRIRRVRPNGIISTVLGAGSSPAANAPASESSIRAGAALVALADGSLLFGGPVASGAGERGSVWRVSAGGQLARIAGDGSTGHHGDGGPALDAGFGAITGLDRAPDGALIVGERESASSLPFYHSHVRRIAPGGTVETIAGGGRLGSLPLGDIGDGGPATASPMLGYGPVVAMPDGGVLWANSRRVRRIGPLGTGPIAVELERPDAGVERPRAVTFAASQPAAVTLDVLSRGRLVRRVSGSAQPGPNTLTLPGDLPRGRALLRLTASRDGQLARDTVAVLVGGFLPLATARAVVRSSPPGTPFVNAYIDLESARTEDLNLPPEEPAVVIACRRMAADRVDCAPITSSGRGRRRRRLCSFGRAMAVWAGSREARGGVLVREYQCSGRRLFQRSPLFGRPAVGPVP